MRGDERGRGAAPATDITGFGLLGHVHEMAQASGCAVEIDLAAVPVFDRALDYAERGVVPGRTADVIAFAAVHGVGGRRVDPSVWMRVLCDPQTSGGLLMSVPAESAQELQVAVQARGSIASRVGARGRRGRSDHRPLAPTVLRGVAVLSRQRQVASVTTRVRGTTFAAVRPP